MQKRLTKILLFLIVFAVAAAAAPFDPLPSWNDGKTKSAILAFVANVTDPESPDFVPLQKRIATFDNDGTLWSEQPMYTELFFVLSQIRAMAKQHPEWKRTEPYKSALAGDVKGIMKSGKAKVVEMLVATHSGMTAAQFHKEVSAWLATAKNPKKGMLFTQMVYKPMLELMALLRANGFKTYIVSGGGVDFMRVFTEKLYDVPPQQVVGSTGGSRFEMVNGIPTIVKTPKLLLVDDKAGKPVGIYRYIGRRPIFAAGNSDGDIQMLEYTTVTNKGQKARGRMGILIHHTDGVREFAYDRKATFGKLNKGLDEAPKRGWTVVDMKNDWKVVFPSVK
jgi:hypothetical protein